MSMTHSLTPEERAELRRRPATAALRNPRVLLDLLDENERLRAVADGMWSAIDRVLSDAQVPADYGPGSWWNEMIMAAEAHRCFVEGCQPCPMHPARSGEHVDLVGNEWAAAVQRRIARLPADAEQRAGDYQFTTAPHDDADCPFADGDVVPMDSWESTLEACGRERTPSRKSPERDALDGGSGE